MNEEIRNYIGEEPLGCCFSDISGRDFWKAILGSYWHVDEIDETLELPAVQGVLLHGPYGSGKNTLLQAMAGEMVQGGYRYLEMDFQKIPKTKAAMVFDEIKRDYLGTQPIFLFLNRLDLFENASLLWEFYHAADETGYPVILAGAVENETDIAPDIRKLFHSYWIDVPDRMDRKAFFVENLESLFEHASIQGMEKLLDGTEGYNYIQMESLVNQLKLRVKYTVLKEGKTLELAMAWLEVDFIEEALERSKQPKMENHGVSDVSAILQALSNIPAASAAQTKEAEQPNGKDPLEDLRAKYSPKKVFDQGLMFAKK